MQFYDASGALATCFEDICISPTFLLVVSLFQDNSQPSPKCGHYSLFEIALRIVLILALDN